MTKDEQDIRAVVEQLVTAWNAGDGRGFAAPFAADADFVNVSGIHGVGQALIGVEHQRIFDTFYRGSRNHYEVRRIRFLGSDAAVVLVEATLQFSLDGARREARARPSIVMVRGEQGWQIVHFQNTFIGDPKLMMAAALQLSDAHAV